MWVRFDTKWLELPVKNCTGSLISTLTVFLTWFQLIIGRHILGIYQGHIPYDEGVSLLEQVLAQKDMFSEHQICP
jgi:hypothetical protein